MCTVSVITISPDAPLAGGFRIVCNRDENRRRPLAAAPKWRSIDRGPRRAIWPMDMEAGGTWIGAAESGLCLCLLNLNPEPPVDLRGHGHLRSRGLIIPDLIGSASAAEAIDILSGFNLRHYAPFRLLAVDPGDGSPRVAEARWDRRNLDIVRQHSVPVCLVSSGLGDALVAPRLDLFEELVVAPGQSADRQDEFHRHIWPTRPELSVMMSRADARTVSVTTLDVARAGDRLAISMDYEPVPDAAAVRVPSALARSMHQ